MRRRKTYTYEIIFTIILLAFVIYVVASWADVVAHNMPYTEGYGHYAKWNVWFLFDKILRGCR